MLRVRWLGSVSHPEASALQRAIAVNADDDYLLMLEHPHVFTMGVRADPANVLVEPRSVGAALVRTDRGGDVTYHGPGQLVVYPVVTVANAPSAGREHVRHLEDVVIGTLEELNPSEGRVGRLSGYPGVWVDVDGSAPRKIAAVGTRLVRTPDGRRRSIHGVAINIDCDLSMFDKIVPCGIVDRPVTSLRAEGFTGTMADVVEAVTAWAIATWGADGQVDRQAIATTNHIAVRAERPPFRRLRQAGVDPLGGLSIVERKPSWLRVQARMGQEYLSLGRTVRSLGLTTVCEEAGCPNIYECWADGTATFMVNGSRCTRACGFCMVDTAKPLALDPGEPERVAEAVVTMGLAHAVVTCVARDDRSDGGAGSIAATIDAIRERSPGTAVEVLVSDCRGDERALQTIFDAKPDILNHNVETVARLQRAVRPSAGYARSLAVLGRAAQSGLVTKSGLMVGLGETESEVLSTLADLSGVGVSIATVGQYLRPSSAHLPVARWWTPEEFERIKRAGTAMGIRHVEASPLTRSSYHARASAESLKAD